MLFRERLSSRAAPRESAVQRPSGLELRASRSTRRPVVSIPSPIWSSTAVEGLKGNQEQRLEDSPYAALTSALGVRLRSAHEGLLGLAAGPPESVARIIERAITTPRPRTRYVVPPVSQLFVSAYRWLPDRAWDALMRRMYPVPGGPE